MSDVLNIDWEKANSTLLLSDRFSDKEKKIYVDLFEKFNTFQSHIWLNSSGSSQSVSQSLKLYALSKNAILQSAQAVNNHFNLASNQNWLVCLPTYHVGGLSILARSFLSGSKIFYLEKWDAKSFCDLIKAKLIQVTSLVPTQVYDLVSQNLKAPKCIKFVIVGGEALSENLYRKACELGWPIYQTYGMTELCSQIATQEIGNAKFKVLQHVTVKTDQEQNLFIKSESLFTGFAQTFFDQNQSAQKHIWNPAIIDSEGFWKSADRASLDGNFLTPLGRDRGFIKINGIGVSTTKIENWFKQYFSFDVLVDVKKIEIQSELIRTQQLICYIETKHYSPEILDVIKKWNEVCSSIEKIHELNLIDCFERTDLGKLKRGFNFNVVEVVDL